MKTLLSALSFTLLLLLTACGSDDDNVVCDANGCRNTSSNATLTAASGCFINNSNVCSSNISGVSCYVNSSNQCVQSNCSSYDVNGNCVNSTTVNVYRYPRCTLRDRFGNCLSYSTPHCRYRDVFGRCYRR